MSTVTWDLLEKSQSVHLRTSTPRNLHLLTILTIIFIMASVARNPVALLSMLNLAAITGNAFYFRSWLQHNHEENEARMDELEGTFRAHVGIIEESLERLEGKKKGRIAEKN